MCTQITSFPNNLDNDIVRLLKERTIAVLANPASSLRDIKTMVGMVQKFADQELRATRLAQARERAEQKAAAAAERSEREAHVSQLTANR